MKYEIHPGDLDSEYSAGNISSCTIVHKFGHNDNIGTSYVPITDDGIFRTPVSLTSLEVVSDSADDASAGIGATKITVVGIGTDWKEIIEEVTMNGLTAVALSFQFYRVYRIFVSESGSYADAVTGSHVGTIAVREAGAGDEWGKIDVNGLAHGQSEIGVFTIPAGKIGFIRSVLVQVDSTKVVDVSGYRRENADVVAAPYTGTLRIFAQFRGVSNELHLSTKSPIGSFVGPCDVGFMGKVASGTGSASVDFEMLLKDIN